MKDWIAWPYAVALIVLMLFWPIIGRWAYWSFVGLSVPLIVYGFSKFEREGWRRDSFVMACVLLVFIVAGFNAQPLGG